MPKESKTEDATSHSVPLPATAAQWISPLPMSMSALGPGSSPEAPEARGRAAVRAIISANEMLAAVFMSIS